jgi:hypothetical protein
MSCDTCKDRQTQGSIPGNVFYEMEARNERTIRRLIVAVVLAVILMFASNALWLYAWQQYDYTGTDITQDGEGLNIVGDRNGVIFDGTDGENPDAP